jgi:hypothetical protein
MGMCQRPAGDWRVVDQPIAASARSVAGARLAGSVPAGSASASPPSRSAPYPHLPSVAAQKLSVPRLQSEVKRRAIAWPVWMWTACGSDANSAKRVNSASPPTGRGGSLRHRAHIFIPGAILCISIPPPEAPAGPCAPTASMSSATCTLPAFSNSRVIESLSPFRSGRFSSISIR